MSDLIFYCTKRLLHKQRVNYDHKMILFLRHNSSFVLCNGGQLAELGVERQQTSLPTLQIDKLPTEPEARLLAHLAVRLLPISEFGVQVQNWIWTTQDDFHYTCLLYRKFLISFTKSCTT